MDDVLSVLKEVLITQGSMQSDIRYLGNIAQQTLDQAKLTNGQVSSLKERVTLLEQINMVRQALEDDHEKSGESKGKWFLGGSMAALSALGAFIVKKVTS